MITLWTAYKNIMLLIILHVLSYMYIVLCLEMQFLVC